jgi:hypothetical protein
MNQRSFRDLLLSGLGFATTRTVRCRAGYGERREHVPAARGSRLLEGEPRLVADQPQDAILATARWIVSPPPADSHQTCPSTASVRIRRYRLASAKAPENDEFLPL